MGTSAPRPIDLQPIRELLAAAYVDGAAGVQDSNAGDEDQIIAALRDALVPVLTVEPCHVTGMHDPNHTDRYLCEMQMTAMVRDQLLPALDATPGDLPRRLHDEGTCHWCHDVPSQEEYREKRRALHQWADAPISEELASPAADAMRPHDPVAVLTVLREEPEPISVTALDEALTEYRHGDPLNYKRRNAALRSLMDTLEVEQVHVASQYLYAAVPEDEIADRLDQRETDIADITAAMRRTSKWATNDWVTPTLLSPRASVPRDRCERALREMDKRGLLVKSTIDSKWMLKQ